MEKSKNKIIAIMCVAIMIMAVGYAYFATNLNITSTGSISSSWDVRFTNITNDTPVGSATNLVTPSYTATTATMSADLKLPGDSITYRITLKNNGDIPAIIESIDASATGSGAIIFSISGLNIGDKLAGGDEKEIVVKIEYDPYTTNQPSETEKTLTVSIKAVQDMGQSIEPEAPSVNQPMLLSSAILKNNTAQADTNIDFGQPSEATGTNGLYYTSTNTEGNNIVYYFRGAVTNNYVKFGKDSSGNDLYWKIIRINEDGSIRIIYNGTSVDATGDDVTIGSSAFNTEYNDNAYVGYMYGTAGSSTYALTHSNDNPSTIKGVIDDWYENNLKTNYSSYLADAGFCNDRSVAPTAGLWDSSDTALGYGTNDTLYGAYNRLYIEYQPQFACPNASSDLFTTSTSSKGNKALGNPIGLITADEVWYAGATTGDSNTHYLYTGSDYWTMSPFDLGGSDAREWFVVDDGYVYSGYVDGNNGVRPVVNLQSTVETTGGNGTKDNPYIININ